MDEGEDEVDGDEHERASTTWMSNGEKSASLPLEFADSSEISRLTHRG